MKMTISSTLFALALLSATTAHAASIETVLVANNLGPLGNAGEQSRLIDHSDATYYGGVAYDYRIGKTEVTNAQYVDFLNGVAKTDSHGLYNPLMGSRTQGGITRSGSPGSYTYAVKTTVGSYTYGNKPVVYVSFWDAARFANWMHSGMGSGDTESGSYSNIDTQASFTRNEFATWVIPTEDEWYKAAFYDPNKAGGAGYWDFATGSVPNNHLPTSDTGNSANFFGSGYTTGNPNYPLTDAGAYAASDSAYGTHDQNGNVSEWNETAWISSSRGLRGGGWRSYSGALSASYRINFDPSLEDYSDLGFRVASVPEPSSIALLVSGLGTLLLRRRRRK